MTYVSRHTRLLIPRWLEQGDDGWIYALRRKRSDHKLKFLNSCEDLRAWVDDECLRTQHFIESMTYSEFLGEAPFGIFGRFIPITYLFDFLNGGGLKEEDASGKTSKVKGEKVKDGPAKGELDESLARKNELLVEGEVALADEGKLGDAGKDKKSYYAKAPDDLESLTGKEGVTAEKDECSALKKEELATIKEEGSFIQEEKDYQLSLDLLCKYCELLCQAVNKLEEVDLALNSTHNHCTCENSSFNGGISFEEFFSNCQKYMIEDSETRVDSCCYCGNECNCTDDSLPPTPEPSIGPSISCDRLSNPRNERIEHGEGELLRRISNLTQRYNQIENNWRELNEEIDISQRKLEEYREFCNCQETEKVKELREKLQELVFERGCIYKQKREAMRDLNNLKYSAYTRFTKSDISVERVRSLNFGKFPSCQCGFEEFSTSNDTSSSERKSRISFSPLTRGSINGKSIPDVVDQSSYRVIKLDSLGSPRKSKSESELQNFIKALRHYEKRVSCFDNLNVEVEVLKQKALRADYFQGELKKINECRDESERKNDEEKDRLCEEIEDLKCVIDDLKNKLCETCKEVDYWQCKNEEIMELEKEANGLKKKLNRSEGDYKETKKYNGMLEQLVALQRNQIERLIIQINKMSKFIGSDKKASEMSCKNKLRSKSYSPDAKRTVRSSSTKIIRTIATSSEEKQGECCCMEEEPNNYTRPRSKRKTEPRSPNKYERKKVGKKCLTPSSRVY